MSSQARPCLFVFARTGDSQKDPRSLLQVGWGLAFCLVPHYTRAVARLDWIGSHKVHALPSTSALLAKDQRPPVPFLCRLLHAAVVLLLLRALLGFLWPCN